MKLLTVNRLTFAYPHQKAVLRNLSFNIDRGEIVTILGPNGAGKSTLLQCLLGILSFQGSVILNSHDLTKLNRRTIAQQIAYVPQQYQQHSQLTVIDYVLTGRTPYLGPLGMPQLTDYKIIKQELTRFNLESLQNQPISSLSGGQLQLITIIKALIQQPQLLILDEPMAALDLKRQQEVIELIQELAKRGVAILLTTHQPDHALMLEHQVGLLSSQGNFTFGPCKTVLTEDNLQATYQVPVKLCYLPELQRYTCQLIM